MCISHGEVKFSGDFPCDFGDDHEEEGGRCDVERGSKGEVL